AGTDTKLIILRLVPVLARDSTDYFGRLLGSRLVMALPGHDPSIQLMSPHDLAHAVCCAVESNEAGIYNVAPENVIPLRAALRLVGSTRVPVPRWLQRLMRKPLARVGFAYPVDQLDYIRYSWTVSNKRIKSKLGFAP